MRFNYFTIKGNSDEQAAFSAALTEYGEAGWEVTHFQAFPDSLHQRRMLYVAILERVVTDA
jgi:hypothetical protein